MDLTRVLQGVRDGDEQARADLIRLAYQDLRRLASACMRSERPDHTLNCTALVNEVSLKLLSGGQVPAESRNQFLAYVARAMRNVLVDYARSRATQKRGGHLERFQLREALVACREQSGQLLELNAALERLAVVDERKSKVVELRYFGGMSVADTAEVLGLSPATVKRDWEAARTWLYRELNG